MYSEIIDNARNNEIEMTVDKIEYLYSVNTNLKLLFNLQK